MRTLLLPTAFLIAACSGATGPADTDETDAPTDSSPNDTGSTVDTGSGDTGSTDTGSTDTGTTDTGSAGAVVINEVLADNDAAFEDPDNAGEFEDVLELHNTGSAAVDLSGWTLDDAESAASSKTFTFPNGTSIAAGGTLVVLCNGTAGAALRTDFGLGKNGDTVTLKNGSGTLVDEVSWSDGGTAPLDAQVTDESIARSPDGGATWVRDATPTIGASNG